MTNDSEDITLWRRIGMLRATIKADGCSEEEWLAAWAKSDELESRYKQELIQQREMADAIRVGSTLVHELCHAALDCEGGHGYEFNKLATGMGLIGNLPACCWSSASIAATRCVAPASG